MVIKRIYSKLRHWYNRKWLHKTEMDIKIEEMRRRGYIIGEKCHLYSALGTAEPYLVEIKGCWGQKLLYSTLKSSYILLKIQA